VLYQSLSEIDPEVKNIIDKETWRQFTGLELIASEVRLIIFKFMNRRRAHHSTELD